MNYISAWFRRHFSDPQVMILMIVLVSITASIYIVGDALTPLIAAMVLAYLLQGVVNRLVSLSVPQSLAVILVFLLFLASLFLAVFGLLPPLLHQVKQLFQQVPTMITEAQRLLMQLPDQYPQLFTVEQVTEFVAGLRTEVLSLSQPLLSLSISSVITVFSLAVYFIIVPLLVFFLLRDRARIVEWFLHFVPRERELTNRVWKEVNNQIGNYVRGKVWEIFIVGAVSFAVFTFIGLDYALLLGALTGLSVLIPYVGAALITIPVAVVAYFQWGMEAEALYALIAYGIIQALDGNLLAPLLFSEVVDLHPVAIIVAILFFGGLWGIWGVFFAIPLATVIQAVLRAWPTVDIDTDVVAAEPASKDEQSVAPARARSDA